jgi:hypothetical protein
MPILIFWVMPCGSVSRYKDEGNRFLKNVSIYLQVHMVLEARRPTSMMGGSRQLVVQKVQVKQHKQCNVCDD